MTDAPEVLGPYRIVGLLGRGGMGAVYRGEHLGSGQSAAIKTVRIARRSELASLRREIHTLSRIRHPGVVQILDQGLHDGVPWYAMELVQGLTLRQHAEQFLTPAGVDEAELATIRAPAAKRDRGTRSGVEEASEATALMSVPTADASDFANAQASPARSRSSRTPEAIRPILTLMRRLCSPLAFLHGEGIVHRDLKPGNIMVRPDGRPTLVDFGLVSRFGSASGRESLEPAGQIVGTPAYMAPEQVRGELVDARADLYALGCILYELLAGEPPFVGPTSEHVLAQQLMGEPRPISERTGLPAQFDALLGRLLAKRPQDRFGHAADVASALAELGAEPPPPEAPQARAYVYRPGLSGRAEALAPLLSQLRRLESGTGGLTLVGGESGVGKTLLVQELAREARMRSLAVLLGECSQIVTPEAAEPAADAQLRAPGGALEPLREALRHLADRCRERGPLETERLFGPRGPLLAAYEPSLLGLPGQGGARIEAQDASPLPPAAARHRLLHALAQTFSALAQEQPVLLVLDDLQWADELTIGFLDHLLRVWNPGIVEAQNFAPLLVVGTYRTEEVDTGLANVEAAQASPLRRLIGASGIVSIVLGRLDEPAVARMIGDMLAFEPPPERLARFLTRQSEGNPFFVAEYLRAAVTERLLYRDAAGRWQVAAREGTEQSVEEAYAALPLPAALRDLVGLRLEGLSEGARRLAEAAAVLGREMQVQWLGGVARQEDREMLLATAELLERQVMEETAKGTLRFVHEKIREVTYERIPGLLRQRLHRAAAETLERETQGPESDPLVLGQHWLQAGAMGRAKDHLLTAARRAVQQFALGDAERLYRTCSALAAARSPEIVAIHNELGTVLRSRGHAAAAVGEHQAAQELARELGLYSEEIKALRGLGAAHHAMGRLEAAEDLHQRAIALGREQGDPSAVATGLSSLASLYIQQGRMELGRRLTEESLAMHRELGSREDEAATLVNLGALHGDQGRHEDAIDLVEAALAICVELGQRRVEAIALTNLAMLHNDLGRPRKVEPLHERALRIVREIGDRRHEGRVLGNLSLFHFHQGRFETASELREQALRIFRELGDRAHEGLHEMNRVHSLYLEGNLEPARRLHAEALAKLRQAGYRTAESEALGLAAALHLAAGEPEQAHGFLEQALTIAREQQDRSQMAQDLRTLAQLRRLASGAFEEAEACIAEAIALLREVNADRVLALCLCEQGHIALAVGRSAEQALAEARTLAKRLLVGPRSELGRALECLRRAQARFGKRRPLFRGQCLEDVPAGLRRWLEQNGLLASRARRRGTRV